MIKYLIKKKWIENSLETFKSAFVAFSSKLRCYYLFFLMMCLSYFQYGFSNSEPTQSSSRCLLSLMMMHDTKKSTWWRLIIGYIIYDGMRHLLVVCVCHGFVTPPLPLSIPPSPWQHVYKNKWWIMSAWCGVQLAAYTVVRRLGHSSSTISDG